ncbi:pleckstrin homology domain-containing family A member 5-like [Sardina pilchardus]|uniref:pleckstrin homology domain-containing family A member 5-like n=1 Tax=Sardina pilchardus TaxID=27697 RepID=UPI002E11E4AB
MYVCSGMPYPVGIVPPRAKSPITESSSIASYVTLRKSKKPDSRTERPRSAVEQSGSGPLEGVRPRMSVEEQMERIRRHQQASLRRRDSSGGAQESSLSRSSSFNREQISINPYYTLQSSKRGGDAVSPDRQRLEASLQALEQEMLERASAMLNTPSSQEPKPPKPPAQEEELATEESMNSPLVEQSSPKVEEEQKKEEEEEEEVEEEKQEEVEGSEEEQERQRREEQILMLGSQNSLQTAVLVRVGTEEDDDDEEEVEEQEEVKDEETKNNEEKEQTSEKPRQELEVEAEQGTIINYSYELPDETNKHNQVVSVNNLSTPPQSPASTPTPSSPSPPSPPQVADGSHFMCV